MTTTLHKTFDALRMSIFIGFRMAKKSLKSDIYIYIYIFFFCSGLSNGEKIIQIRYIYKTTGNTRAARALCGRQLRFHNTTTRYNHKNMLHRPVWEVWNKEPILVFPSRRGQKEFGALKTGLCKESRGWNPNQITHRRNRLQNFKSNRDAPSP